METPMHKTSLPKPNAPMRVPIHATSKTIRKLGSSNRVRSTKLLFIPDDIGYLKTDTCTTFVSVDHRTTYYVTLKMAAQNNEPLTAQGAREAFGTSRARTTRTRIRAFIKDEYTKIDKLDVYASDIISLS